MSAPQPNLNTARALLQQRVLTPLAPLPNELRIEIAAFIFKLACQLAKAGKSTDPAAIQRALDFLRAHAAIRTGSYLLYSLLPGTGKALFNEDYLEIGYLYLYVYKSNNACTAFYDYLGLQPAVPTPAMSPAPKKCVRDAIPYGKHIPAALEVLLRAIPATICDRLHPLSDVFYICNGMLQEAYYRDGTRPPTPGPAPTTPSQPQPAKAATGLPPAFPPPATVAAGVSPAPPVPQNVPRGTIVPFTPPA